MSIKPTYEELEKRVRALENAEMEAALREKERVMRYIIKHDPNAIAVYDNNLNYIAVSDRYLQDYNVNEKDVLGKHHYEVFPEMPQRWKDIHQRVLKGATERNDDDYFERSDGSITYNRWECRPWYREDGAIGGMITYTEVTTERKLAEMGIRKSEEKYRNLFSSIRDAILVADTNREIVEYNPALIDLFGYSGMEILGKQTHVLYANKQQFEELGRKLKENIANPQFLYTVWYRKKSGETFPGETGVYYLKDTKGEITGFIGLIRNIADRLAAEEEKKRLAAQLLQSRKMEAIAILTGGIAHDYNNLMSIILGNLSLAMDEAEPGSDLADFLNEVDIASRKVRDLTHELMSLSRGGAPVREVGSLDEVLKNISELIPADSGISLMESISQDLKLVPFDQHKMSAVIRNVVKNAVEAMPDGGTLKIKAKNLRVEDAKQNSGLILKPGDLVHISIQDQGKGIPEEDLEKVFDPYFSTKEMGVQKGMGLGLATAYAIVRKHEGHIAIDSSPGLGTTVNIYLPSQRRPVSVDGDGPPAKGSSLKRVLVMDDEEMLRKLVRHMLDRMGYAVETVKNGFEAVETYKKRKDSNEPFDAVILDLTIKGGMGGEQTIGELLKIDPNVKAIVSSGYFNDPVMSDFEKYGFMGALAKPYEKKALKEVLERFSVGKP